MAVATEKNHTAKYYFLLARLKVLGIASPTINVSHKVHPVFIFPKYLVDGTHLLPMPITDKMGCSHAFYARRFLGASFLVDHPSNLLIWQEYCFVFNNVVPQN